MVRASTTAVLATILWSGMATAQTEPANAPEVDACKATGLIALREKNAGLKDIYLDPDGMTIAKANAKVEDTVIRTVIMGDAYLEKAKTQKPYRFLCLIGDKGKVLLTFFTDK